jgi:hypothetical protein
VFIKAVTGHKKWVDIVNPLFIPHILSLLAASHTLLAARHTFLVARHTFLVARHTFLVARPTLLADSHTFLVAVRHKSFKAFIVAS